MIKNIRHTGIVVNNLKASLRFYRDLLGFKVVRKMNETGEYIDKISALKGVKITTVKMAAEDGNLVELLYYGSHLGGSTNRDVCDIGYSHIAFTVEDLDYEYKRLKEKGIKFNSAPQISPDGYAKVTFCCDPEGNLIELVEELT